MSELIPVLLNLHADAQGLMIGLGDSMKRYVAGRILAAGFIGILLGLYVHFDQMRWSQRGRDAFLTYQDHRFDKTIMHPPAQFFAIGASVVLAGIAIGLYELIAAGITHILPPSTAEEL